MLSQNPLVDYILVLSFFSIFIWNFKSKDQKVEFLEAKDQCRKDFDENHSRVNKAPDRYY